MQNERVLFGSYSGLNFRQRYIAGHELKRDRPLGFDYHQRFDKWRFNNFFLFFSDGSGNLVIIIPEFERISEHIGKVGAVYPSVLHKATDKGRIPFSNIRDLVLDGHNLF